MHPPSLLSSLLGAGAIIMKKNAAILAFLLTQSSLSMANVIVNGDFDDNTTGWTGDYSIVTGVDASFPSINTGNYYYGGKFTTGDQSRVSQVYNLKSSDLANLSSFANLQFKASADLFGYQDQDDHSIFTITFYSEANAKGQQLEKITLSSKDKDPGTWADNFTAGNRPNYQTLQSIVPSATKSILFSIEAIFDEGGGDNDGYADNLRFKFIIPDNSCVSIYNDGLLTIPCVAVENAQGGNDFYKVSLRANPFSTPSTFELTTINAIENVTDNNCLSRFNPTNSELNIPCLSAPRIPTTYEANMKLIPSNTAFIFELIEATEVK